MDEKYYIGIDDHVATCSYAIMDVEDRVVSHGTVETKLERLRRVLQMVDGKKHVVLENGGRAAWLLDGLRGSCNEIAVVNLVGTRKYRQAKSDRLDPIELVREFRTGALKKVYHHTQKDHRWLMETTRCYEQVGEDVVRVKNRVKSVFRSVGIRGGAGIYSKKERKKWLGKLQGPGHRSRAEMLLRELDVLIPLKKKAQERMVRLARKRKGEYAILRSVPGIGPIYGAQLLGHIGIPGRFRDKRALWKASGLAVVTRSSADYKVDSKTGEVKFRQRIRTRGLNLDYSRTLKAIFKEAAHIAIRKGVFKEHYERRVADHMRPEMARLTIARKLSAALLTCWQKGERFDPEKMREPAE